jgi:hypothetical protein
VGAWLMSWRLMQGSPRMKCLLIVCVLASATPAWTLRPQAISLLMVAATAALLTTRTYRWLPPLFLIWANMHGAVLTGILLLAAALGAALVENPRGFPRLAAASALCVAATVATPLGLRFWTEIPAFFVRIRSVPVEEFAAPQLTAVLWIPFWSAAAALVALAAVRIPHVLRSAESRRRGDLTLCACALALLVPAVTAARNIGPFLLVAVPAVSVLVASRANAKASAGGRERPVVNVTVAIAATAALLAVVAYAYANAIDHLRWRPLPDASLAAAAACDGNLYNRFDEGGYLIWFLPDRKVFIDSRFFPYPDSLLQEHMRMERTGDVAEVFRHYDIRCAYLPVASPVAARLAGDGWDPLYRDDAWEVLRAPSARRSTPTASAPSASSSRAARPATGPATADLVSRAAPVSPAAPDPGTAQAR